MPIKYPGDAVFEAAPEFSEGAADYAAKQRLERAKEIAKRAFPTLYGAQQFEGSDTWAAVMVPADGSPVVIDDGFATEAEADDCADLARATELRPQLIAAE